MSKNSEYTARHDLPTIKRGDTIEQFSMTVAVNKGLDDEEIVIPDAICAQLRDKDDVMLHVFDYQVDPVTGEVVLGPVLGDVTGRFPIGKLSYDVEYIFESSGRNKTYLEGQINIVKDVSRCAP